MPLIDAHNWNHPCDPPPQKTTTPIFIPVLRLVYHIVELLVNKPDKFRMKLRKSYSVVNKVGTLSIMTNTRTKMYVCT